MSTVVQAHYRPQIAAAAVGLIADEASAEVGTRQCETAAGIGFGLAVSQGTKDKGCIIGGSAFVGVSVRDVTLDGIPLDPLNDGTHVAVDTYGKDANVGVLSRGHIWVEAQANVVGGNDLFYDTTTGKFTNSASGAAARGYLDFSKNPAASENIVINGKTITFKASGATGLEVNIGPTLGDTIAALADMLNASSDTTIDDCTYAEYPPRGPGGGSGAYRLEIACDTVGEAGNSIALTTGTTVGCTRSGATLAGGTAAATAVTGGYWTSRALAGELAKISLGIQR